MDMRRNRPNATATLLATIGSVIYIGLIAREIVHALSRVPWPGFTPAFNKTTLIFSSLFWIAGIFALWLPKTSSTRLVSAMAVFATLMHGLVLRLGAANMSPEGFVYVAFAAILCFVTLDDLSHRPAIDGSYRPGQVEPPLPQDVRDDEAPEPPIDEHRLVG